MRNLTRREVLAMNHVNYEVSACTGSIANKLGEATGSVRKMMYNLASRGMVKKSKRSEMNNIRWIMNKGK